MFLTKREKMTNINTRDLGNSNLDPMQRETHLPTIDTLMCQFTIVMLTLVEPFTLRARALNYFLSY